MKEKLGKAIICDLDGTLALLNGRSPYDPETVSKDLINHPVREVVNTLHDLGYTVVLVSGRFSKYWDETVKWLKKHKVKWEHLEMRVNGDNQPDTELKKWIYENRIKDEYDILLVLDDRNKVVKMWRELGLTCLQVAEGDF